MAEIDPAAWAALQEENARLRAWHDSAWQRGHAMGALDVNQVLQQAAKQREEYLNENERLTNLLLETENQRDDALHGMNVVLKIQHEMEIKYNAAQECLRKTYTVLTDVRNVLHQIGTLHDNLATIAQGGDIFDDLLKNTNDVIKTMEEQG